MQNGSGVKISVVPSKTTREPVLAATAVGPLSRSMQTTPHRNTGRGRARDDGVAPDTAPAGGGLAFHTPPSRRHDGRDGNGVTSDPGAAIAAMFGRDLDEDDSTAGPIVPMFSPLSRGSGSRSARAAAPRSTAAAAASVPNAWDEPTGQGVLAKPRKDRARRDAGRVGRGSSGERAPAARTSDDLFASAMDVPPVAGWPAAAPLSRGSSRSTSDSDTQDDNGRLRGSQALVRGQHV